MLTSCLETLVAFWISKAPISSCKQALLLSWVQLLLLQVTNCIVIIFMAVSFIRKLFHVLSFARTLFNWFSLPRSAIIWFCWWKIFAFDILLFYSNYEFQLHQSSFYRFFIFQSIWPKLEATNCDLWYFSKIYLCASICVEFNPSKCF